MRVRIPRMARCTRYNIVIKFVSDLQQVCGFLRVFWSSNNKTDRHNITEILLKVTLNNITLTSILKLIVTIKCSFSLMLTAWKTRFDESQQSGVKHHYPNPSTVVTLFCSLYQLLGLFLSISPHVVFPLRIPYSMW